MSSVKEATKTVKDAVTGLQADIEEAKDSTMDVVESLRRKPVRRFVNRRIARRVGV